MTPIGLPLSGGQWMTPPAPSAPPLCSGCMELSAQILEAQKTSDTQMVLALTERVVRHFKRRHGIRRV